MRKIVIDGSNTSGFQRTMLVAHGGYLDIQGTKVGVQSICLEEDAAKLISDDGSIREYGLDRLGVPLVEIALEPVTGKPEDIMQIALNLGRLLRASKRVARGLGSIRQDVNISILDGSVVEIKGVQQLDQLIKVIEYEMLRQHGLYIISQRLKTRNVQQDQIGDLVVDVTDIFAKSSSKVVKKTLAHSDTVFVAIRAKGFAGSIGFEPYPEIRLGKQLGELVRFYGLGGVFHSDELPNYGITEKDVSELNSRLQCLNGDAFVLVGGSKERVGFAVDALIQRLKVAVTGVPAETRAATLEGKTVFSRPRPGSARMYPETDIAPIPINPVLLKSLSNKIPMPWDRLVYNLTQQYNLNSKVAEQIFDSKYFSLFEQISNSTKVAPTFIASKLTEDIVNLQRQGLDSSLLSDGAIVDVFNRLNSNKIAKESIVLIFEKIMNRSAESVDDAISMLGVTNLDNDDLDKVIDKIIQDNLKTIHEKGTGSLGMLMGRAMAVLRGKADGQKINALVSKKLHEVLTK
jgi:glutamyl-tRNA(Gln) amidotransferase subunit E